MLPVPCSRLYLTVLVLLLLCAMYLWLGMRMYVAVPINASLASRSTASAGQCVAVNTEPRYRDKHTYRNINNNALLSMV